jgi:hypothetical protein
MTGQGSETERGRATGETFDFLMKKCHLWEIATAVFVMLLSPASFVLGLAIGISPEAWLMTYLRYVALFIILAILVALAGLDAATSCWLRADRAKTQGLEGKPR